MVVFNLAPCQCTFYKAHCLPTISKTVHFTAKLVKNLNDKYISGMSKPNSRRKLPRPQAYLHGLTWRALRYGTESARFARRCGTDTLPNDLSSRSLFYRLVRQGHGDEADETKYVGMLTLSF